MADMADMADLLVIGQVVVDDTPEGPRPGGAAYYSALTATRLGYHVAVVTAPHALLDVLAVLDGVAVHLTDAPATTVFRHRDSESGRISHWSGSGPVMRIEDIPPLWRDTPAVLVAPVAQEVSREIPGLFRRSLVALSPQGWLRRRDRAGLVLPGPWLGARAALNAAQIVIASQEDVMSRQGIVRLLTQTLVCVITQGSGGALLHHHGRWDTVPGYAANAVDTTGAGDVFAVAFLMAYWEGRDPRGAAAFANAAASLAVEREGAGALPDREQITARLSRGVAT